MLLTIKFQLLSAEPVCARLQMAWLERYPAALKKREKGKLLKSEPACRKSWIRHAFQLRLPHSLKGTRNNTALTGSGIVG